MLRHELTMYIRIAEQFQFIRRSEAGNRYVRVMHPISRIKGPVLPRISEVLRTGGGVQAPRVRGVLAEKVTNVPPLKNIHMLIK